MRNSTIVLHKTMFEYTC